FWLSIMSNRSLPKKLREIYADRELVEQAQKALPITQNAVRLALDLAQAAEGNRYTTDIRDLAGRLAEWEQTLFGLLHGESVLGSFLAYVHIERGSLSGETIAEQARETAEIYRRLGMLLGAFVPPTKSQPDDNNTQIVLIEDDHENHAQWS
ncbi:hypothetical protein KJ815_00215, partial [bacterium]|nr:hypothetical protein [bacterium]